MTSPLRDSRVGGRYASTVPFVSAKQANIVSTDDQYRSAAYSFYEDVYDNRPETFAATLQGDDDDSQKIYLPSGGTIIDAVSRFLAVDVDINISVQDVLAATTGAEPDPEPQASDDELLQCQLNFERLFKRERFFKKFELQKKYGLIRGDALWHIIANDQKPNGRRISIEMLHPGQYFPIYDAFGNSIVGCHIVSIVPNPKDKTKQATQRQTYRKVVDANGLPTGAITSETDIFELGAWDDRNLEPKDIKKVASVFPIQTLPPQITSIPVYHVPNSEAPNDTFGRSELAGFETLFNGINQSITDEDMSLVMAGLGMFWTNAPPPKNADGEETSWQLGPGQVIEVGTDMTFGRLSGINDIGPFQDHVAALSNAASKRLGLSDVALGDVDPSVAESGIARLLRLAPILQRNKLKESEIIAIMDQMLYDLATMWFPAYEQLQFGNAVPEFTVGDAMPVDRKAVIDEVLTLIGSTPPLITLEMAVARLAEVGWEYAPTAVDDIFALMTRISDTLAGAGGQAAAETADGTQEELPPEE